EAETARGELVGELGDPRLELAAGNLDPEVADAQPQELLVLRGGPGGLGRAPLHRSLLYQCIADVSLGTTSTTGTGLSSTSCSLSWPKKSRWWMARFSAPSPTRSYLPEAASSRIG